MRLPYFNAHGTQKDARIFRVTIRVVLARVYLLRFLYTNKDSVKAIEGFGMTGERAPGNFVDVKGY